MSCIFSLAATTQSRGTPASCIGTGIQSSRGRKVFSCLPLGKVSTRWVLNHETPKGVRVERGQNLFRNPEAPQLLRGVGKVNVVEGHVPESGDVPVPNRPGLDSRRIEGAFDRPERPPLLTH